MTALVTGATGFLGSALVKHLAARGESVRGLVRSTSDRRRLEGVRVEIAVGDVTDRGSIARALEGADVVYHAAALYEIGARDPEAMRAINVGGTRNVLEAARDAGCLAVHVSSVVALGPTGASAADETHWNEREPRSPYEATKRDAHRIAREIAGAGARVRVALPVTIYGPDDPSLVGRFHGLFARGLVRACALAEMRMSLVHVDDCAAGLALVADRGQDGAEYVLSGGPVTMREWTTELARATRRPPPRVWLPAWAVRRGGAALAALAPLAGLLRETVTEGLAMADGVDWAFGADKARRELGWSPRPLAEGLREVAAFYRGPPPPRR